MTDDRTDGQLVSVIVPCYNKAPYIRQTLASVLDQQGVALEVIVIDDHSTDDSWAIIGEYRDRVTAHRLPENRGSTHSRNTGAELARGTYLMFLDADDLLTPGTLRALQQALQRNPASIATCPWRKLHRAGSTWEARPSPHPLEPPGGDYVRAWLAGWYFPPCAVLWPRPVYEESGGWREMGPWDDAEIMMRAFLNGTRIVLAPGGEALYRILDEGLSLRSLPTERAVRSRVSVLDTVSRCAEERGVLPHYRESLGLAYYRLGTTFARSYPHLVLDCFGKVDEYLGRRPLDGSRVHRVLWKLLGLQSKQRLIYRLRRIGLQRRQERQHNSSPQALA